ncbi:MAG TPA: hypothetical protein VHM30_15890, partial [Gemmatimonadaceae bacterium]|nr:hypothetical protein [Gemmatimonadaceae bacterium]
MNRSLTAVRSIATAALLGAAAACARSDDTTSDSALARDIALASEPSSGTPGFIPADTALNPRGTPTPAPRAAHNTTPPRPVQQRTRTRVAERPAPAPAPAESPVVQPTPAPVSESPRGSVGTLAGTMIGMSTGARVCTNARPGDKIVARVTETSGPGSVLVPAGSTVVLEVASMQVNEQSPEHSTITFRVRSISAGDVDYPGNGATTAGDATEKLATTSKSSDAKKVAAGAVAGAVLGQILGKNTKS